MTYPFPQKINDQQRALINSAARSFYERRKEIMETRHLGLTKLYNLFNNPNIQDEDINDMRNQHIIMDTTVLGCYGWDDIELNHNFYINDRKKVRFMPSPTAQREIFIRLISLNQQISAEEQKEGLVIYTGEDEETENESET
jgi:hypothetical protein